MSVRKWTESQKQAIDARNGTLLISAAAGSGKTAVLVERVIGLISDVNNPVDIDKLLIVTFTKAAANEMRERISNRLAKLIDEKPFDRYLQRQQLMLSKAKISTIHSFCSELIRSNFQKLNVSVDCRVADSNEMEVLRADALQFIIDDLYEENNDDFLVLSKSFSRGRDDKLLLEVIEQLYDFVRSYPFMDDWFDEKLKLFKIDDLNSISDNIFIKAIFSYAKETIDFCIEQSIYSINQMRMDEKIYEAYHGAISFDLELLKQIKNKLSTGNWDDVENSISNFKKSMMKLKALRGYTGDPLKLSITNSRDQVKKAIENLQKIFMCNSSEFCDDMNRLYPIVAKLFEAVKRFSNKLDELKLEKKLVDFSDLEQMTLKLLVEKTESGFKKTEDAIRISEEFYEIMVDEYQDTNETQDMIFRAISKNEKNLFMVGDVKQSIYRFRQAMPEIFLNKKQNYQYYNDENPAEMAKINLDKNFRSKSSILDVVNFMFSMLMSKEIGELEYNNEEKLKFGATYYNELDDIDVSLKILDCSNTPDIDMDIAEANCIAETIAQMIGNNYQVLDDGVLRPITYRDFCILLRSAKNHSLVFSEQLNLMGIPTWSEKDGNFFKTQEVAVMVSFLKIIDNPIQDIPLLSVLMSPIYNFSPDDMSKIRTDKSEAIYFSLKRIEIEEDNSELGEKCKDFLSDLILFTRLSASLTADKLINVIYKKTKYLSFVQAMNNGKLRLANLRMLLDYARTYESEGYKGLSSFIRFIDRLQERKSDLTPASLISENANVVRVMSMHSSKGLEFPVCIIANCSRKFNRRKDSVTINSRLSVGLSLRDESFLRQYTTIAREAVNLENEKDQMSEELRVLYVAMTRAKQKLIMISSVKSMDIINKLSVNIKNRGVLMPYAIRKAQSFSDWILSCMLKHKSGSQLRRIAGLDAYDVVLSDDSNSQINIEIINNDYNLTDNEDLNTENLNLSIYDEILLSDSNSENLAELIEKRLNFKYKFEELKSLPTKVTASELSAEDFEKEYDILSKPDFMQQNGVIGTKRGDAMHKFMAYADFSKAYENLDTEIEALLKRGVLTKEQVDILEKDYIKKFFNTELYNRIKDSDQVFREYKFSVELPISKVYDITDEDLKNEVLILQGAVDCIFIEAGQAVIIDYKTDHSKNQQALSERYKKQLDLYALAVEKCFDIKVKEKIIYSFYTASEIRIKDF